MKKRLIAFVCMLLAFVLCFSLVACDGQTPTTEPNPNGPNTPVGPGGDPIDDTKESMTVKQALNAVDKLFANEDGWKGTASYKLSSANTEELADTIELEKRGNRVEITIGDESLIYDMTTGYGYYKEVSGYYASQMTPGGLVDYARYLIGGQLTDELTGASFKYDKETMTAHFELDMAKKINDALAPLYDAYKYGKNIKALLDAYCKQYLNNVSFDALYDAVAPVVYASKDYTVNELLTMLKASGIDVIAILEENGIEIPEAQMREVFGPRKVGEMVAGAYMYINSIMADMTADGDEPEIGEAEGDGMQALLIGLVNAMFMEEVDEDMIDEAFTGIDTLIKSVLNMNVKEIIDGYKEMLPTELYVMIQNGVKIEALKLDMNAVFDKDKNITELNVAADFKHDYKGDTEGFVVLCDNNYHVEAELKIDEYTDDIGGFEFAMAEHGANLNASVTYIVYALDGENISVYFELGGQEIDIIELDVYVGNVLDEKLTHVANANVAKFNTITSCFEFDGEFIARYWNEEVKPGDAIMAVAHLGDEEESSFGVTLVYMNDDLDQIMEFVQKMAENMVPTDPDVPNIDDGGYEEMYA